MSFFKLPTYHNKFKVYLLLWLQFIPGTHLVFSAGKDHMVKCWDGDKFNHVMSLLVCIVVTVLVCDQ